MLERLGATIIITCSIKKAPFNDETYTQFGDDILAYWYYCSTICKELGFVATKIFINNALPIGEEVINLELQNDIKRILEDDSQDNYITTVQEWKERLGEWNELLIEEERMQSLDITEDSDELQELERPEYISISSEFN
ncbi:hypothetical protein C1645_823010 [Glomus cerebriforme]|uniref:Uncharacterized protein n=1 Tax=Glomus cerebriforme TaxID=658196 RepID=A0A397SYI6_9GLOM|nr:hypothetical protein C1645_823010 [Glomus cerebriforme]